SSLDSEGGNLRGGVEFMLTSLLRGEVGAGYLWQDYADPGTPSIDGYSYLLGLTWNPTPLMTLNVTGEREVKDAPDTGTGGRIQSSVVAQLDYEVLRNLILSGRLRFEQDEYVDSAREDTIWRPGVLVDYYINRNFAVGA